jgi:deoxyribose-phosphate aldolase
MIESMSDRATIAARVLPLIDLTSLGDNDDEAVIDRLCDQAVTPHGAVAAICVWPRFVAQVVARMTGHPVEVAAVANFPEGDPGPARAVADAEAIVAAGGTEVDVVYPWRALAAGDDTPGRPLVQAVRDAIGDDTGLKVILETGELDDADLIRRAAQDSLAAGADFLKTSTGKTPRSATPEAAAVLLDVLAEHERSGGIPCGLKVSGGVRTVEQAGQYLAMADDVRGSGWVGPHTFRFGASALLGDVLDALSR